MANFRKFKTVKLSNIIVGGEYEHKMSPWVIIFLIAFKMKPTDFAEQNFDDEHEMRMVIAQEMLGKSILNKNAENVIPAGWMWDGIRYSYNHNPQQFSFRKNTAFQVEFYVEAPESLRKADDKKGMEIMFKKLATSFSKINNFTPNQFFQITPAASVK